MINATLTRRLERLESAGDGSGSVVVMECHEHETNEHAEARWRATHPGVDLPPAALRLVLVRFDNDLPPLGGTP